MKVFPLIHSRTGGCDYSSKLAVRPPSFGNAEIEWARKKILPAMKNISLFDGIRYVVASKGGICIAGIVCTMKYFVNNCLSGDDQKAAENYSAIQGTKYGVFLGCAFNKGDAPDIIYSDLWEWFYKYLKDVWNRKFFDGVESKPEDCDNISRADKFSPSAECFSAQIYDAAQFDAKKLFEMYLSETASREISFCSNVENIQHVEDGTYNVVTTSAGNISTLKDKFRRVEQERRPIKKEPEKKTSQTPLNEPPTITEETPPPQQKYPLPISLAGLTVLLMIVYWLMKWAGFIN